MVSLTLTQALSQANLRRNASIREANTLVYQYQGRTVSIRYANYGDLDNIFIDRIVIPVGSTLHITVPALKEGITHHIGSLTVHGAGNTLEFASGSSSTFSALTLADGSELLRPVAGYPYLVSLNKATVHDCSFSGEGSIVLHQALVYQEDISASLNR